MVFHMLLNSCNDTIESILNSLAGSTKLSDDVDEFEGRATVTERPGWAEEWTSKHCMKLNEDKYLHLKARLYVAGKQLHVKNLGVLEENKIDPIGQDT